MCNAEASPVKFKIQLSSKDFRPRLRKDDFFKLTCKDRERLLYHRLLVIKIGFSVYISFISPLNAPPECSIFVTKMLG